jgi:hypothetical protein
LRVGDFLINNVEIGIASNIQTQRYVSSGLDRRQDKRRKNAMLTSPLLELTETKTYTVAVTYLLQKIMTDRRLIGRSAQLWKYLYTLAAKNKDLIINISIKKLAEQFCYSERTIRRYMDSLRKWGYLCATPNFNKNGQTVNTFQLVVAEKLLKELNALPNRKANNENIVMKKTVKDKPMLKESLRKLCIRVSISRDKKAAYDELNQFHAMMTKSNVAKRIQGNAKDKIVTPRADNTDRPNTILKKQYTQKQDVVLFDSYKKENQHEAILKRKVTPLLLNFIEYKLKALGFYGSAIEALKAEIIFSIEKGSLQQDKKGHSLSVLKAINIALKLVKTNRWYTPSPLRKIYTEDKPERVEAACAYYPKSISHMMNNYKQHALLRGIL